MAASGYNQQGSKNSSYFGRSILDNNRTKIGGIRFFTNFGSAMFDMQLKSGKIQQKSLKTHCMDYG